MGKEVRTDFMNLDADACHRGYAKGREWWLYCDTYRICPSKGSKGPVDVADTSSDSTSSASCDEERWRHAGRSPSPQELLLMRSGDEILELPQLEKTFLPSVEKLRGLSPGDLFLQPPAGFPAIDSICIVGNKAYLFQVTRDLAHKLNVGVLAVLACLPRHLDVEFIWVLPFETWQLETFTSKDLPELADFEKTEKLRIGQQQLVKNEEELVNRRLKACRQQYKIGIPLTVLPLPKLPKLPLKPKSQNVAYMVGRLHAFVPARYRIW